MKFTKKWVVVPYSSISSQKENTDPTRQIFRNKSLSKDEKLANYNDFIIRKLRKNQQLQNNDAPKDENELKIDLNDEFEPPELYDEIEPNIPKKRNDFQIKTPKRLKTGPNLMDKSFFNLAPSKNTRRLKKISSKSFTHILDNTLVNKKRKKKQIPTTEQPIIDINIQQPSEKPEPNISNWKTYRDSSSMDLDG